MILRETIRSPDGRLFLGVLCHPGCGNIFLHAEGPLLTGDEILRCGHCGRTMTRKDLTIKETE